jgi:hypothetical protein
VLRAVAVKARRSKNRAVEMRRVPNAVKLRHSAASAGTAAASRRRPASATSLQPSARVEFSNRSNQALVIDLGCQQGVVRAPRQAPLYRAAPVGEKIELLFRHPVIMCAAAIEGVGHAGEINEPIYDSLRKPPTVFIHPKGSSMRLRLIVLMR